MNETDTYRGSPAFVQMLADNAYRCVTYTGDGRYVALHRLLFHWTMLIGDVDDLHGYTTRYCYSEPSLAQFAIWEWERRGFDGEPIGWHRHPDSGRRRPDGDASREYIEA